MWSNDWFLRFQKAMDGVSLPMNLNLKYCFQHLIFIVFFIFYRNNYSVFWQNRDNVILEQAMGPKCWI